MKRRENADGADPKEDSQMWTLMALFEWVLGELLRANVIVLSELD